MSKRPSDSCKGKNALGAEELFSGRSGPVLLIVLDGWGIGSKGPEDAIAAAKTPNFDRIWRKYPTTSLLTHGPYVGLPNEKDLGGSEVGHLTMGAGRILDQGPTRINRAIEDGSLFRSEAWQEVLAAGKRGGTIHLIGLLSDGGIHSHIDHFVALIQNAAEAGVKRLRVHALLDGRDVEVQSAHRYVERLERDFDALAALGGFDYRFASGGGRERIVMDRDKNWDRVREGWEIIVHGNAEHRFSSMQEAIEHFRREMPGLVDQDMPGFVIVDEAGRPVGPGEDGDAVVMVNFRGDRAIEITEAFELDEFPYFDRGRRPKVIYAGMMVYDEDRNLPRRQLIGPTKVDNPFGDRLLAMQKRQFRIAETQKYAHVTFFFNGGRREPKDEALELYRLIPSEKDVWFADRPEMKAREIGEETAKLVRSRGFDFGLVNFANADMVGHCGVFEAAVAAVEAVDRALGVILEALVEVGGRAIITADHGNAECMWIETSRGREPSTKHTTNPVPCIAFDPAYDGRWRLRRRLPGQSVAETPGLAHLAATLFELMGIPAPKDIYPSLIEPKAGR